MSLLGPETSGFTCDVDEAAHEPLGPHGHVDHAQLSPHEALSGQVDTTDLYTPEGALVHVGYTGQLQKTPVAVTGVEDTGHLDSGQSTLDEVEEKCVLETCKASTIDVGQTGYLNTTTLRLEVIHQARQRDTSEFPSELRVEQGRLKSTQVTLDDGHAGIDVDAVNRSHPTIDQR